MEETCEECGGRGYTLTEGPNPCEMPNCPGRGIANHLRELHKDIDNLRDQKRRALEPLYDERANDSRLPNIEIAIKILEEP